MVLESQRSQRAPAASAQAVYALSTHDYEQLATFRYALRQLTRQTELEAREVGLTPQHYQILLAIKGFPGREWASISELAERLQIRHNAVIGLVNRAEARGLVRRVQDAIDADHRIVQIHLTPQGERMLRKLADALRQERQQVQAALQALDEQQSPDH